MKIDERLRLTEKNRRELIAKSKASDNYKDMSKGRNRWERRTRSKVAATVADYNKLDMDAFWKGDILEFGIRIKGETADYTVQITFENVLDEIRKEIVNNKNKLEFKCILRALIRVFNSENVYVHCTCLHPDTKIKLLDGTNPTVKELADRFNAGEKLYVFSVDAKGDFKPGEVENVWITKITTDFIKITLDNNQEILTTPNHLYMLRDGSYAEARDLKINQLLMSADTENNLFKNHKIKSIEYITLDNTPVYDISVKDWSNFAVDAGVVLHNCKDFFYRQAYWSTKGKYNSGTPQYDNGKRIANPNDTKGAGCKHVNLVLSNVDWLMKIASVINNYIWYCKDNMELNYAKYIFPKLYGMDYDKAIQLTINDIDNPNSDSLTSDEATLNLSNALGRRRTQFKKLPQQSVNPRYQKPKQQQTNSKDRTLFDLDKEDSGLKNESLNESILSNKFKTETAGYILDDGSFVFVDEYHGDDPEYKNKQYPEFSNTHPEDDTCIRIYKEPNENQYKQLEKIIDIYLDREGYCKIELWSSSEAYYFYKIFSLYENACADDTFEENIGNWNGYKLVQIIKNNIK